MITQRQLALITYATLDTYFDELNERVKRIKGKDIGVIFVADCLLYATLLFINNGWTDEESYEQTTEVIKAVLNIFFLENDIDGEIEFNDDLRYVLVTCK